MGFFTRPRDEDGAKALSYRDGHRIGLTASAQRVNLNNAAEVESLRKKRASSRWQTPAWEYYDLIPEIKFSANLIANVASRIRLYPGYITDPDSAPSDITDVTTVSDELKTAARETLRLLETGNGGTPGLLRDAALNMFVAGECYLVREPALTPAGVPGAWAWQIRSVDEIVQQTGGGKGAKTFIKGRASATQADLIELPASTYFGRIWRTHPRWSDEADSSLRGMLELCDQLLLYSRASRGVAKSRLNAGILFVPDAFTNVSQADGELSPADDPAEDPSIMAPLSDDDSDSFEEELMDAATTPISDEGSAASVVPLLVRGPAELGEKIRHITFDRAFDPAIAKDADKTLDRILSGLDIPKEVVAGMANAKYANAIVVEKTLMQAHVEPLVLMIVDALTVVLMRPVLRSLGFSEDEIARVTIWYDPSDIQSKPDKATAANQGFEMKAISAQAWRRANGFQESDKPTDLELAQRLAMEKGLISENIMDALLYTLMPELLNRIKQQEQATPGGEVQQAIQQVTGGQAPTTDVATPQEPTQTPPATPLIEP